MAPFGPRQPWGLCRFESGSVYGKGNLMACEAVLEPDEEHAGHLCCAPVGHGAEHRCVCGAEWGWVDAGPLVVRPHVWLREEGSDGSTVERG